MTATNPKNNGPSMCWDNCIDYIYIVILPILYYTRDSAKSFCNKYMDLQNRFDLQNYWIILIVVLLIPLVIILVRGWKKRNSAVKGYYDSIIYNKLRAEKDECAVLGGGISLETIFTQLRWNETPDLHILFWESYVLLLAAIFYRRLSYAIYMQEYYKENEKQKMSCPFSPPLKGTIYTPEASHDDELNDGNTLHIIYNGKETPNIQKIIKEDTEQPINATKVFLSFSVK